MTFIIGGDFTKVEGAFHPHMTGAFDDSLLHATVSGPYLAHFQFEPSLQQVHQAFHFAWAQESIPSDSGLPEQFGLGRR